MLERTPGQNFRELDEITIRSDTRDILSHATKQAEQYEDYFLVDIDAHVSETQREVRACFERLLGSVGTP